MLLSRFWFLVLAACAGLALAAAWLAQAAVNRQYARDVDDALRRDRIEVELVLRVDRLSAREFARALCGR